MTDSSIAIIGLPASGKTTFLAALWHLMVEEDIETVLRLKDLLSGDVGHLNEIAARWRDARLQARTVIGATKLVSMNLINIDGAATRVTFPDIAGEAYQRMWGARTCDPVVADVLRSGDVMLFVHADDISYPKWVVEEAEFNRVLGLSPPEGEEVAWDPSISPTQVKLVGILQLLQQAPLDIGPRRLAVMLSAWDKVSPEGLSAADYLRTKLPLLDQYLRCQLHDWEWRVYGLSAQGGDYDVLDGDAPPKPSAEALRELDQASTRIKLVTVDTETHDLTEPLAWLMQ